MIPFLFPLGIFLAVILIWFFFRSGGYKRHPLDAPPGPDWIFTGERFLRSAIAREMLEVWTCPQNRRARLRAGARGAEARRRRRRRTEAAVRPRLKQRSVPSTAGNQR